MYFCLENWGKYCIIFYFEYYCYKLLLVCKCYMEFGFWFKMMFKY